MNTNPFWQDDLSSLKMLWKTNIIFDKSVIRDTPLWYNPMFILQIRRDWKEKGIMIVSDFMNYLTLPLSLEKINIKFHIKMNFLEYGKVTAILKKHFEWKEIPETREPYPRNSFLNTILAIDKKGVSNLYRILHHKWEEKTLLNFSSIDISIFVFHHSLFKDCYLKYTQFRTLHRSFTLMKSILKWESKPVRNEPFVK